VCHRVPMCYIWSLCVLQSPHVLHLKSLCVTESPCVTYGVPVCYRVPLCYELSPDVRQSPYVLHMGSLCVAESLVDIDKTHHTYGWVMAHIRICHSTCMNASCHTYDIWVSEWAQAVLEYTHVNTAYHTNECVIAHIWMRHVIHMTY